MIYYLISSHKFWVV